jgi:hypothetical protein
VVPWSKADFGGVSPFRAPRHVLDPRSGFDSWTDGTYRLRLLEVRPAPLAQRPIQPEDYRLTLVVNLVLPAQ